MTKAIENLEIVDLAFDILDGAEVMQEFDDSVWVKIDKELWDEFQEKTR